MSRGDAWMSVTCDSPVPRCARLVLHPEQLCVLMSIRCDLSIPCFRSPIKTAMERQKQAYKAGWLTSPNSYKKEEIEEIGTTTPKKITKVRAGETILYRLLFLRLFLLADNWKTNFALILLARSPQLCMVTASVGFFSFIPLLVTLTN